VPGQCDAPFGSCPRRSSRVQPHPILPLSPCHPRLRLGTSPKRPRPQPLHRTGQAGQPPDCHTSEIRLSGPFFTALPPVPDRHLRGGTNPHGHARFPAFLPAAPGSIRRAAVRQCPAGQALSKVARAHRTQQAHRVAPGQPGRGLPAKLLTAIARRCTSDVPGIDLKQTGAATERRPAPRPRRRVRFCRRAGVQVPLD
jgi:hypothetical protein